MRRRILNNPDTKSMKSDSYEVTGDAPDWSRVDVFGYPFTKYQFRCRFDSRADYLAFRCEWTIAYRELSNLIRSSRGAYRGRYRRPDGMAQWRSSWTAPSCGP